MGDDHQKSAAGTAFQEESIGHPSSGVDDIIVTWYVTLINLHHNTSYGCDIDMKLDIRYSFSLCTPYHVLAMSLSYE